VSVSNLYIPPIDQRHMNVESGTEAAQFPEKEYLNRIFVVVRMKITTHSSPHALYNVNIFEPFICGATVHFYEVLKFLELFLFP
jgi:hypothetical protein